MAEVQESFKSRLPNLFVPTTQFDEPLALRPYQLRSAAQHESLALALNQATYISFNYPGFQAFMVAVSEVLVPTLEMLGILSLHRVVFRYDNELGIRRTKKGILPIDKLLKLTLPHSSQMDHLMEVNLDWTRAWECGRFTTNIVVERRDQTEILKFSLAATLTPAGPTSQLAQFAASAHAEAREAFEQMITDDFRQYLNSTSDSSGVKQ